MNAMIRITTLLAAATTMSTAFVQRSHVMAPWTTAGARQYSPVRRFVQPPVEARRKRCNISAYTANSTMASTFDPLGLDPNLFERQAMEQYSHLQHLERAQATIMENSSATPAVDKEEGGFLTAIWRARLLLLAAAALYGTNFSVVKIMGDTMPVGVSSSLRFGLAALATLPWLVAPPKEGTGKAFIMAEPKPNTNALQQFMESMQLSMSTTTVGAAMAGFEVGLWNSVGYLAQAVGLQTTEAGKSAFICSLAVVIVPMLDFLGGRRLKPREMIGAAMAVAGVGFLEFGGAADLSLSSGDIASLLQPIVFGVAFSRMERAMRLYPNEANRSTAAQLLAVFLTSMVYCAVTTMDGSGPDMAQVQAWLTDPQILGALFWTGCITTALTVYMEAVALKTLTAAETTIILSTEPLWGAGVASVLIGEQFGFDGAIGAVLILAGCVFSNLGWKGIFGRKTAKAPMPAEGNDASSSLLMQSSLAGAAGSFVASLETDVLGDVITSSSIDELEVIEEVIRTTTDLL